MRRLPKSWGRTPKRSKIAARKIDAALGEIDGNVLPEIGELESAARQIGQALALGVAIAEEVEHHAADRIGGTAGVAEEVVDGIEAGEINVGAKGAEQIGEGLARDIEAPRGIGQSDEDRMARGAGVGGVELVLPIVEPREAFGGSGRVFVGEVIGDAGVSVNRVHVRAHRARHQPRGDGKVFVMGAGEPSAPGVGLDEIRGQWRASRNDAVAADDCTGALHHADASMPPAPINSRAAARAHPSVSRTSSRVRAGAL